MPQMSRFQALTITLAAFPLVGCSSVEVTTPEVDFEVIEEVTFDESLQIDLTQMTKLPSGVYIQDRVEGTGEGLVSGDRAYLSYSGWLRNGVLFDTGQFDFILGTQQVITGFELGMIGMKTGGTRLIIVPPELGYGAAIVGPIPPGSILIFEVELNEISTTP
jgi:FKBP-type peptidyl-prolyl cis-trans isomerase